MPDGSCETVHVRGDGEESIAGKRGSAPSSRALARGAFERRLLLAARHQLAERGAAGLGMRGLARELGVTPGALYRYVESRDALLTLLILDAYRSLATAVRAAEARVPREELAGRWLAVWRAVREWALAHRHEYALLYGSPVPGYDAPPETAEPASAVMELLAGIAIEAFAADTALASRLSAEPVSPQLAEDMRRIAAWVRERGWGPAPDAGAVRLLRAWTELFGTVSFELFGHYRGGIHAGEAYLDEVARTAFAQLTAHE